jgi:hypothetical protein
MTTNQEQITRLEGLLARLQRNAERPRARVEAAAAPEPVEELVPIAEPALVAEPEPAPEPVVAPVEEETSMVRAIEEAPDMEVSVETGEAVLEDLDLLEDDIVDITEEPEEEIVALADAEVEEPEEEPIEPPASSRRAIAGSVSEALAGAADAVELDDGREVPLKTPPPESGPQAAPPPPMPAPIVPQIDEAPEAEMVSGTQPTAAQLGATVDLEPATEDAELELGLPVAEAPPVHLVREEAPVPQSVEPQVIARPVVATAAPPGAFVSAAQEFHPKSFAELLDASLALGRE